MQEALGSFEVVVMTPMLEEHVLYHGPPTLEHKPLSDMCIQP